MHAVGREDKSPLVDYQTTQSFPDIKPLRQNFAFFDGGRAKITHY